MLRSRTTILVLLGLLLAALLTVGLLSRALILAPTSVPPAKQTFAAGARTSEAAAAAITSPWPTKPPALKPAASCPIPTMETGIEPFTFGPFPDRNFTTDAQAKASNGAYYRIWAGAPDPTLWGTPAPNRKAPQEGLLRVLREGGAWIPVRIVLRARPLVILWITRARMALWRSRRSKETRCS